MKRIVVAIILLVAVVSAWFFAQRDEQKSAANQQSAAQIPSGKAGTNTVDIKSVQEPVSARPVESNRSIWQEYANSISAAQFYAKYRNAPVGSTERFLADYAVLSCGAVTTIGPERFAEFSAQ